MLFRKRRFRTSIPNELGRSSPVVTPLAAVDNEMPKRLTVNHTTVYKYHRPVMFNEHRLMFRPRDSHDMRLLESRLTISPPATVRWLHDVFGNSTAIASFEAAASELRFEAAIELEHYGITNDAFPIEPRARTVPFPYTDDERADLGRAVERHYPDPDGLVEQWVAAFCQPGGTPTERLLVDMTAAVKSLFRYVERHAPGVQTPAETLRKQSGTCRDFALFLMEAARSVGIGARFVSGYLYDPAVDGADAGIVGAGATHAWVQLYLPGAGWVEFDPTNGIVGGPALIRVAVARDPSQAIPITGTYNGAPDDFAGLTVEVTVRAG